MKFPAALEEMPVSDWARAVEARHSAPSAANRQPWRFDLDDWGVTVAVVKRGAEGSISRLLDVGIAMLHFEVGARQTGVLGRWELAEPPLVARYHPT